MIQLLQVYLLLALYLVVFAMTVVALVDVIRRPADAFPRAGKRTKNFWLAVVGAAVVIAFIAIPPPLGIGALSFLALGSAVAAGVYLADVKPALGPHRRGGGPRGGSPRGGW